MRKKIENLKKRQEKIEREIIRLEKKKAKLEQEVKDFTRQIKKIIDRLEKTELIQQANEIINHIEKTEFMRQVFASSGGKFRVANKIASLIPEHKIYVEPFAGGASVFFAKKPSEVEVLNDKDSEVAFAYKFIQKMTDEELNKLKQRKWEADKDHFYKLLEMNPKNDIDRFYKFVYIRRFSYGAKGGGAGYDGTPGEKATLVERLPKIKERLRNVKIYNKDYKEIIEQFDSKDTFFYLDPPYPDTTMVADWKQKEICFTEDDLKELNNILEKIKGKFILSTNPKYAKIFKKFKMRKIKTSNLMNLGFNPRYEYIIYNFDLKQAANFIHDVYNYNPRELTNEQLAGDWRVILAWYCSKKQGKKIPYSYEDIMNLANLIYNEIVYRVKRGEMKHEFQPEKMKPCAREVYEKLAKLSFSEEKATIEFLGTGPDEPIQDKKGKSNRKNSSILVAGSILVDATPQVEEQLGNRKIDAVIITHAHEDAISGLPKLKKYANIEPLPVYAFGHTIEILRRKFPKANFVVYHPVDEYKEFTINGITFTPIPIEHSVLFPRFDPTMALKIDTLVYAEDIDQKFLFGEKGKRFRDYVRNANIAILDGALCKGRMPGHCNIFDVLDYFKKHNIDTKIIFTQIGHNCPEHNMLVRMVKKLNKNADIAYDGMKLKFDIINYINIKAIYLPNAELFWNRDTDIVILPDEYYDMIEMPLYVVDDDYCYGVGFLAKPDLIQKDEYEGYAKTHNISIDLPDEFVYVYKFTWINRFTYPIKIMHKTQPKTNDVRFIFLNFQDLPTEELINIARTIIQYDRESPILNIILEEMKKRGKVKDFVLGLMKSFRIIRGFISLIGSTAEKGAGNDIDFLIRMSEPSDYIKRAVETRIRKMLPENIEDYIPLHFVWGDEAGAHDTYIPLFDLALMLSDETQVNMSKNAVKLFEPYLPQKPKGSAYYDIDKLLDRIW